MKKEKEIKILKYLRVKSKIDEVTKKKLHCVLVDHDFNKAAIFRDKEYTLRRKYRKTLKFGKKHHEK